MIGVVILAAGQGKRMGAEVNKPFLALAGKPILARTLAAFAGVGEVILVAHPDEVARMRQLVADYGQGQVIAVVPGGATRGDSVYQGLCAAPPHWQRVLIHDGARPLVTAPVINRVVAAVAPGRGAIPGLPLKDTVKLVDQHGLVQATPERETLRIVQTPQGFMLAEILAAYEEAQTNHLQLTDDAGVFAAQGGAVVVVAGDYANIKITTPEDIIVAHSLLGEEEERP